MVEELDCECVAAFSHGGWVLSLLNEIFGVTLDELVLDKKSQTAQPQSEPQVQMQSPSLARKIAGTILLCFGMALFSILYAERKITHEKSN